MNEKVLKIGKWVLFISLLCLIAFLFNSNRQLESQYEAYMRDGTYISTYNSKTIRELKKENKELYDKIKNKSDVKQAAIIKYKYKYNGETIYVKRDIPPLPDSIYAFNKNTDSISYELKIKSAKIDWYNLNFSINDKLVLVNRETNGQNELTIQTNGGTIESTQIFNKKDNKNNFFNRFSINVQAGVGYGLITKKPDVYVGIGFGYRLNKIK